MAKEINWKITDTNFVMMKKWLAKCATHWPGGWEAKLTLTQVVKMVDFLEKQRRVIDDTIIEAVFAKDKS